MSEQEYDGLTLEGLAQRLEALERADAQRMEAQDRGEAGTGQTGEEPVYEFVGPASSDEKAYGERDEPAYESYGPESMGKLEQAQRLRALKREELTQRLEVLEHENASLRGEVASLRGSGTGILGTLLRVLTMLNRREAISRAGYDLQLNSLLITGHSNQRNVFAWSDGPGGFGTRGAAVTALGTLGGG